jgi:hypothetical protein
VATPGSHTSAHELIVTVAPFQAWRSSLSIVARGPTEVTITTASNACGADYPHFPQLMQHLAAIELTLIDVAALRASKIEQKSLTSIYGGGIAVTQDKDKGLLPKASVHQLVFSPLSTKVVTIDRKIRGAIVIEAEKQSFLGMTLTRTAAVIRPELAI